MYHSLVSQCTIISRFHNAECLRGLINSYSAITTRYTSTSFPRNPHAFAWWREDLRAARPQGHRCRALPPALQHLNEAQSIYHPPPRSPPMPRVPLEAARLTSSSGMPASSSQRPHAPPPSQDMCQLHPVSSFPRSRLHTPCHIPP